MTVSSDQIKAARALLGWSQDRLAGHSRVSASAIGRFERGQHRPSTLIVSTIQRALEAAGIEFSNGDQPGVTMKTTGESVSAKAELDPFGGKGGFRTQSDQPCRPTARKDD